MKAVINMVVRVAMNLQENVFAEQTMMVLSVILAKRVSQWMLSLTNARCCSSANLYHLRRAQWIVIIMVLAITMKIME